METGPLAELAIPGLQRIGRRLVLHHRIHASAHLFHLLEIGEFRQLRQLFGAEVLVALLLRNEQQVTDDIRPAIHHQVFRREAA